MATEKNATPSSQSHKPPLFVENESMRMIRRCFEQALSDVDTYVAQNRQGAADARARGEDELAEVYESRARRRDSILSPEFRRAADQLLGRLYLALYTGEVEDVVALAKPIDGWRRRDWLRACERSLRFLETGILVEDGRAEAIARLPYFLGLIEERGATLTAEQISRVIDGVLEQEQGTVALAAAKLACECGAFGYGPKDVRLAKKALTNANRK
jgi:hypothetical protein